MGELARVLHYDHLGFTDDDRINYYTVVVYNSQLVYPDVDLSGISNDPDDDKFIECALAAKADYLISGDSGLLDVGNYRNVDIHSPAAFLDLWDG